VIRQHEYGAARPQAFSVEEIKVAHGGRCGSAVVQDWLWRRRRKEQSSAGLSTEFSNLHVLCFTCLCLSVCLLLL
jgi:hypothetical protein